MADKLHVTDSHGRVWVFDPTGRILGSKTDAAGTTITFDIGGRWLRDGKEASCTPDIERASREGTLRGDPMIARRGCNYSLGSIVDYFCLACGSSFAAHDGDSDCWRILKSDEELRKYDEAMATAGAIRDRRGE